MKTYYYANKEELHPKGDILLVCIPLFTVTFGTFFWGRYLVLTGTHSPFRSDHYGNLSRHITGPRRLQGYSQSTAFSRTVGS